MYVWMDGRTEYFPGESQSESQSETSYASSRPEILLISAASWIPSSCLPLRIFTYMNQRSTPPENRR
jgi:hypothetical protein